MTKRKRVERQQKIVWGIVGVVVIILLVVLAGYSTELRTQVVVQEAGQGPGACYSTVVGACTQVPLAGKCQGPDKYFWAGQDCREDYWLFNHSIEVEGCETVPDKEKAGLECREALSDALSFYQSTYPTICPSGYVLGVVSSSQVLDMTPLTEELDGECRVTCGYLVACLRTGPGYIGDVRPVPTKTPI